MTQKGCHLLVTSGQYKDQIVRTMCTWSDVQHYQGLLPNKTTIFCWLVDEHLESIGGWSDGIAVPVSALELVHVPDKS